MPDPGERSGRVHPADVGPFEAVRHAAPDEARIAAQVREAVDVGLDEILAGEDVDGAGRDLRRRIVADALHQHTALQVRYLDPAVQRVVADVPGNLDVRLAIVPAGNEGIEAVLDVDDRRRAARGRRYDAAAEPGRRRPEVGAVVFHLAAAGLRGELAGAQRVRALVEDRDLGIVGRPHASRAGEVVRLDVDVAAARLDLVDVDEARDDVDERNAFGGGKALLT